MAGVDQKRGALRNDQFGEPEHLLQEQHEGERGDAEEKGRDDLAQDIAVQYADPEHATF